MRARRVQFPFVSKHQIWIGIAEAVSLPGVRVPGAKGAAVSVLAWANDPEDFRAKVARMLQEDHQLQLVELNELEPFSAYIEKWESTGEILTLFEELETQTDGVRAATFHWWMND